MPGRQQRRRSFAEQLRHRLRLQAAPPDDSTITVRGPALALLLVGIVQATLPFMLLFGLVAYGLSEAGADPRDMPTWSIVLPTFSVLLGAFAGLVIIGGAVSMMRLRSHGWAVTAATLALLPCGPVCLLGLPVGIWALARLNTPEVKAAFRS